MEYQKIILLITGLLVVLAIYLAVASAPQAKAPVNSTEAQDLLFRSAAFGKGIGDYSYSYSDVSDGYKVVYSLIKSGDSRRIDIQNPLSLIRMYLLPNDTILCITYPENASEICSSVKGNAEMDNYVSFTESKFFNDTYIQQATANLQFLRDRGYLQVSPDIKDSKVGPFPCRMVDYTIDYRNLSLAEAAQFSIGSNSPKLFQLSSCIDNASGLTYKNTLDYTDNNGLNHSSVITVSSFSNGASGPITPPQNLSGDAVAVLSDEKTQQVAFAACFTNKVGPDREKCVSDTALNLHRKDLCEYAGSRRDRCLVALVPLTKDQTICGSINDPSFKDDCYVELAGAYKNSTWCAQIVDQTKVPECQDAAKPLNVTSSGNMTSENKTNSTFNPDAFLNYIDQLGENTTSSNETAMNGTMAGNVSMNASNGTAAMNETANATTNESMNVSG